MKRTSIVALLCSLLAVFACDAGAQESPLSFRRAIELALKNSVASYIAKEDVQRAKSDYFQSRDLFLPQITVGSGLAYSNGFPLSIEGSAPSIFDVNSQQFLVNFAQRQFIKAARADVGTSEAQSADKRNEIIMEAALDYIQLALFGASQNVQREQQQVAAKLEDIVNQRVQAGIDSSVELTRAKLNSARARLQIAESQTAIDQLRLRLSQLTGLPQNEIQTSTETIPEFPSQPQDRDLAAEAVQNSPAVRMADQIAVSKEFRAKGEERQLLPSVDLVSHYAVLTKYNNYQEFFSHFQRNNVVFGVAIRFPFFNSAQKEVAKTARAEAIKAQKEVQNVREQVSSEALRQQHSIEQFTAARDVAKLEHQLAQSDLETMQERIQTGGATLKEEEIARITEHERYAAYMNSSVDLDKAQIQFLRQIGQLENWALGARP
jgi:outer membrane protein TolC